MACRDDGNLKISNKRSVLESQNLKADKPTFEGFEILRVTWQAVVNGLHSEKQKNMARLFEPPPFLGTRDGVCVYKMWDDFYIRSKSSLTSERVKTAPEFEKTRENAKVLVKASKIASRVYANLSSKQKQKSSYKMITGRVMKMLKNGLDESEIVTELRADIFTERLFCYCDDILKARTFLNSL